MTDAQRLAGYIEVWWQAVDDFTALLEDLPEQEWSSPTDLAGWDVRAIVSHTAHLESILAGAPEESADVQAAPHIRGLLGHYTEIGVLNRLDASPDALLNEIRSVTTQRHTALLADPPSDAQAKPPVIFTGVGWSWEVLLRNRPLDIWMHEQDIRRATGRPGGLDTSPAQHTIDYLLEGQGYALAKRTGAPPGSSLVIEVEGTAPSCFKVDDDGRGRPLLDAPASPTTRLRMGRETFIVLAGGRRMPEPGAVEIHGDQQLGQQHLAAMGITP